MNVFLRADLLEVPYDDLLRFLELGFCAFLVVFGSEVDLMVRVRVFAFVNFEGF